VASIANFRALRQTFAPSPPPWGIVRVAAAVASGQWVPILLPQRRYFQIGSKRKFFSHSFLHTHTWISAIFSARGGRMLANAFDSLLPLSMLG